MHAPRTLIGQRYVALPALALVLVACRRGDHAPEAPARVNAEARAGSGVPLTPADSIARARRAQQLTADSIEMLASVPGMTPGADCPDPGPSGAADSAAQAAARIPVKVGLTLSYTWRAAEGDYDHECLTQVTSIDARSVMTASSCPVGAKRKIMHSSRRLCRADLMDSHLYVTETYDKLPDVLRGALQFSLAESSFASLKHDGRTPHRYLAVEGRPDSLLVVEADVDGTLVSEGPGTFKLIINDSVVEVPTIEATHRNDRKHELIRVKVLDDARFPMMLDYYHPGDRFFITYTKVSFPTEHQLEQQLATEKRVDVYGIYFDVASDSLRPESAPVLREIAAALAAHPEWKLTINGHTDSVGTAASNLDLSKRRSATVRRALAEQYGIDGARLSTNGYGASQPKSTNATPEGRARNRRVELVRE